MSGAAELGVDGALGWLRFAAGLALLAAPGLAAVDRFLGSKGKAWLFAPVFSLTLLPLTAILLDLVLQAPVVPALTALYAVVWVVALEWPRRRQALAFLRSFRSPATRPRLGWRPKIGRTQALHALAFVAVLASVAMVQSLPHLPGDEGNVVTAYPTVAVRWFDGVVQDDDYPYPVHVDEHYHLAHQAEIEREGHINIVDPYTGQPYPTPLFSVQGFRDERGFDLALVQMHQLTGLSLPAQARIGPALESAVLAGVLYATLWPAPGALASAALIVILPTTVRFLGPAFLVPSAFALPWIPTALHVSLRGSGGRRLAALALLETGAFFLHLVLGTLVLATAAGASLARPGRRIDRVTLAAVCFLPLLWIGPLVTNQVTTAVAAENDLPFQPAILAAGGLLVLAAAMGGAALAVLRHDERLRPHGVLVALALGVTASLLVSIKVGHHSDATYSRLVPTFFVCVAGLGGLGLAWAAERARAWRHPLAVPGALALLTLIVAAPAVANQLETPYYHIFDAESWQDAQVLSTAGLGSNDTVLCDPWLGPIYNMVSGARMDTVLIPGTAPNHGEDWSRYLSSNGANATWLRQRSIDVVVAPVAPQAPHVHLGGNVYKLNTTT